MLRVCLAVFDPPVRAFNTAKTEEVSGLAGQKKIRSRGDSCKAVRMCAGLVEAVMTYERPISGEVLGADTSQPKTSALTIRPRDRYIFVKICGMKRVNSEHILPY